MAGLKFAPWSSDIELSFYAALATLKINHDKLDDAARKIVGRYEVRPQDRPERSCRMQIHGNAFTTDEIRNNHFRAEGILKNFNTIESYRDQDRAAIVERAGRIIWDAIIDGTIYSCPSLLSSFYAIFFADLKKYRFTYHFLFPAIHSDPPWQTSAQADAVSTLTAQESKFLFENVQTWKYGVDPRQHGFFLAKRSRFLAGDSSISADDGSEAPHDDVKERPVTPRTPKPEDLGFRWVIGSLSSYETGFFKDADPEDCYVCFADPSSFPQNPGWMLRNLLVLVRQRWRLQNVQILCYRDTHIRRDQANSVILRLESSANSTEAAIVPLTAVKMPKVTGWERNAQDKLNSNLANLADYMDPKRLADQSVDLNLKLMKWRIAPDLDLDIVKNSKCLLLGAGTLGSYVSRNLLGWGVRKITFVDNAKVSFSNPVRQPLFNFNDCIEGGANKAERAASALAEIYPGVESKGHVMSVPMAGHPITDEKKVKIDFEILEKLIDEHDAVFLLMDTRESRWLPTVMGKAKGKIIMNAALGFDTYVVMRHGGRPETIQDEQLGCYFCNDVVAPADVSVSANLPHYNANVSQSLTDRTLDQQCTVTRPGVAAIASALLVELFVSVLQHPLRDRAPAPKNRQSSRDDHSLGLVPHQIRGYLATFDNMLIQGPNYSCCSACSSKVVDAYKTNGWEFVKRALNEKGYVEELSGLAEVQRMAEEANQELEWDEEDEEAGVFDEEGELL